MIQKWPCGFIGSGFATQQRLRSLTAGVELPALFVDEGKKEAFAATSLSHSRFKLEAPASESFQGQSLRMRCCELECSHVTTDVATRRRARVAAWLVQGQASHAWRSAPSSCPTLEEGVMPPKRGSPPWGIPTLGGG